MNSNRFFYTIAGRTKWCGLYLSCCVQHILDKNSVPPCRIVYEDVCVLMIPTKPLNFRKPRIEVNYDFAIGSLIVVNLFKNDL